MFRCYCLLVLLLLHGANSYAADTGCPEHFAGGVAPDLINPELSIKSREICYAGFAVRYSGVTRTPLYAAEYLTRERLLHARQVKRRNQFHPDLNIPADERAELHHYAQSGYDRGHLAPAADMPGVQSQYECFSMANMVQQAPANNRGVWARLEKRVRKLADTYGRVYVITGVVFNGNSKLIGGAVSVPAMLFKAVLVPGIDKVWVYEADNSDSAELQETDLQKLEAGSGIRVFPGKAGNKGGP